MTRMPAAWRPPVAEANVKPSDGSWLGASPNMTSTRVPSGRKSIVEGTRPSAPIQASGASPPPAADQALIPFTTSAALPVSCWSTR